jgi:hypothetical protein
MPVNPAINPALKTYAFLDIAIDAMIEVSLLSPGEPSDADITQWVFRKANYLLDEWAAQGTFVYSVGFQRFQLVPNLSPHTIGAGTPTLAANFPVAQRPVDIESASILLPGTNGQFVDTPLAVEDDDWWAQNPLKGQISSLPTHLYYSADNPNGNCYFWPISSVAFQTRLRLWSLLAQFSSVNDPIDGPGGSGILPPAYRQAIMLTLAEQIGGKPDPTLSERARKARAAIMGNNMLAPRIRTDGGGIPSSGQRKRFNFLTREPW